MSAPAKPAMAPTRLLLLLVVVLALVGVSAQDVVAVVAAEDGAHTPPPPLIWPCTQDTATAVGTTTALWLTGSTIQACRDPSAGGGDTCCSVDSYPADSFNNLTAPIVWHNGRLQPLPSTRTSAVCFASSLPCTGGLNETTAIFAVAPYQSDRSFVTAAQLRQVTAQALASNTLVAFVHRDGSDAATLRTSLTTPDAIGPVLAADTAALEVTTQVLSLASDLDGGLRTSGYISTSAVATPSSLLLQITLALPPDLSPAAVGALQNSSVRVNTSVFVDGFLAVQGPLTFTPSVASSSSSSPSMLLRLVSTNIAATLPQYLFSRVRIDARMDLASSAFPRILLPTSAANVTVSVLAGNLRPLTLARTATVAWFPNSTNCSEISNNGQQQQPQQVPVFWNVPVGVCSPVPADPSTHMHVTVTRANVTVRVYDDDDTCSSPAVLEASLPRHEATASVFVSPPSPAARQRHLPFCLAGAASSLLFAGLDPASAASNSSSNNNDDDTDNTNDDGLSESISYATITPMTAFAAAQTVVAQIHRPGDLRVPITGESTGELTVPVVPRPSRLPTNGGGGGGGDLWFVGARADLEAAAGGSNPPITLRSQIMTVTAPVRVAGVHAVHVRGTCLHGTATVCFTGPVVDVVVPCQPGSDTLRWHYHVATVNVLPSDVRAGQASFTMRMCQTRMLFDTIAISPLYSLGPLNTAAATTSIPRSSEAETSATNSTMCTASWPAAVCSQRGCRYDERRRLCHHRNAHACWFVAESACTPDIGCAWSATISACINGDDDYVGGVVDSPLPFTSPTAVDVTAGGSGVYETVRVPVAWHTGETRAFVLYPSHHAALPHIMLVYGLAPSSPSPSPSSSSDSPAWAEWRAVSGVTAAALLQSNALLDTGVIAAATHRIPAPSDASPLLPAPLHANLQVTCSLLPVVSVTGDTASGEEISATRAAVAVRVLDVTASTIRVQLSVPFATTTAPWPLAFTASPPAAAVHAAPTAQAHDPTAVLSTSVTATTTEAGATVLTAEVTGLSPATPYRIGVSASLCGALTLANDDDNGNDGSSDRIAGRVVTATTLPSTGPAPPPLLPLTASNRVEQLGWRLSSEGLHVSWFVHGQPPTDEYDAVLTHGSTQQTITVAANALDLSSALPSHESFDAATGTMRTPVSVNSLRAGRCATATCQDGRHCTVPVYSEPHRQSVLFPYTGAFQPTMALQVRLRRGQQLLHEASATVTGAAGVPAAPTSLGATAGVDLLVVEWAPVPGAVDYELQANVTATTAPISIISPTTLVRLPSLPRETPVSVRVRARARVASGATAGLACQRALGDVCAGNAAALVLAGPWSAAVTTRTLGNPPQAEPGAVRVVSLTDTTATVAVDVLPGDPRALVVYAITERTRANGAREQETVRAVPTRVDEESGRLIARVAGLSPFTTYAFRAAFVSAYGEGPMTAEASTQNRTLRGVPGAPSLRNLRETGDGLLVQWSAPGQEAGPIDFYTVYFTNIDNGTEVSMRVQEAGLLLQGLVPGSTYTVTVTASTPAGESERSRVLTHTLLAAASSSGSSVSNGALAGIAVAVVLIVAVAMVVLLLHSRRQQRAAGQRLELQLQHMKLNADQLADQVRVMFSQEFAETIGGDLAQTEEDFARLEVDRTRLQLSSELGKGAFGVVYRGTLTLNGQAQTVAVKTLLDGVVQDELTKFLVEARLMSLLRHDNLLRLVAVCTRDTPFYLVTEFMPKGDLKRFLRDCRPTRPEPRERLTTAQLNRMVLQIASAMQYLESRRVIHRDLAARNVLVDDNNVVKIADFGMSRNTEESDYYKKRSDDRVPIKWMAPESVTDRIYTSRSDVWSFGVLTWEVYSFARAPYAEYTAMEAVAAVAAGYRLPRPDMCPEGMYTVMQLCWAYGSQDRPSFAVLAHEIDFFLRTGRFKALVQAESTQTKRGADRRRHHHPAPSTAIGSGGGGYDNVGSHTGYFGEREAAPVAVDATGYVADASLDGNDADSGSGGAVTYPRLEPNTPAATTLYAQTPARRRQHEPPYPRTVPNTQGGMVQNAAYQRLPHLHGQSPVP